MDIIKTDLLGVVIIEPRVHFDERGFFMESFNQKNYQAILEADISFVQDNHSKSTKGVLRGLHYQLSPMSQGKLVRVISGEIFDIVVDIRKNSPSCGHWIGIKLTSEKYRQLWIPSGFAHGFLTLSETAEMLYKTTDYYNPHLERVISWNDKDIGITLPGNFDVNQIILSNKDLNCAKKLIDSELL